MSKSLRHPNARDDWQTPAHVLELVRQVAPIKLDPATVRANPTGAEYIRTPECDPDGLATDWSEFRGLTFVNPPYRGPWYEKIAEQMERGAPLIALIMAKPGAGYFQDLVELAHCVCFWRGRITFLGAPSTAPFDSAFLYHGPSPDRFRKAFSGKGWLV